MLTRRALEHCDVEHEIVVVADGAEALSAVKLRRFDMILLDIKMPRVDGFEVLKQLLATPAAVNVPVIVVSGSNLESDRLRASTLGAAAYVHKAIDCSDFQYELKTALAQYGFC